MNPEKIKRIANYTLQEKESLFNIISRYSHILEDKKTNRVSIEEKNTVWRKIEQEFNCSAPITCFRNCDQLKRLYENKKKELRKKMADNKKEVFLTGGGPPPELKVDPVDQVLLNIINKKSVEGLVVPFDSDSNYEPLTKKNKETEIRFEFVPSLESGFILDDTSDIEIQSDFINNSKISESINNYKKCPPVNLQTPISDELRTQRCSPKTQNLNSENAFNKIPKTTAKTNRRRPIHGIKTLTSSDVAEKYNVLLDRRLNLIEKQIEHADQILMFSKEEQQQKMRILQQQEEILNLEKVERKIKVEQLQLELSNKNKLTINNVA